MKTIAVDFSKQMKKIKPLHGVNNGPLTNAFTLDASPYFKDAGIPFSRLHDTEYPYGHGNFIDIPCVFKNFDADPEDPAAYSFAYTDAYLKAIIDCGTKVVYRLGVTIENWAKEGIPVHIYPPKDHLKWAKICAGIVRHYNGGWANGFRFHIEYWEIWNEPEASSMWRGTPQEFYELYAVTAAYLKQCFPEIKVGGYGSIGFYQLTRANEPMFQRGTYTRLIAYMRGFLQHVSTAKAPLDFFSWHLYSNDPQEYVIHAKASRDLLTEYGFHNTEIFLDEWNMFGEYSNCTYQRMRELEGAAMISAVLCTLQETPVNAAMYYDAQPTAEYCGLFRALPRFGVYKAFYALKAFGDLFRLGMQAQSAAEKGLYACAATDGRKAALMFTNYHEECGRVEIDISGFSEKRGAEASVYSIDANHDLQLCGSHILCGDRFSLFHMMEENNVVLLRLNPRQI